MQPEDNKYPTHKRQDSKSQPVRKNSKDTGAFVIEHKGHNQSKVGQEERKWGDKQEDLENQPFIKPAHDNIDTGRDYVQLTGKSGVSHSADLDAEDALRKPKQKKDIPDGWDFIIQPQPDRLETIERPDVVLRSDYFKPLEAFVYPMTARIVVFLFFLGLVELMLTLFSVLVFRWEENTIWWSTGGAIITALGFVLIMSKDKKEFAQKRSVVEEQCRRELEEDTERLARQTRAYNERIQQENAYVTLLNHIRTESKGLFSDKRADDALAHFEHSLIGTFERIEAQCPNFVNDFVLKELRAIEYYNEYEVTQKIMVIKDIFAMHLYLIWMVDLVLSSRSKRIDNDVRIRYGDLRNELQATTQHQLVCSHIAKIANIPQMVYCSLKVERFLSSIDLNPHNQAQREANIRSRLVHIHNLYKKLTTVLGNDDLYNQINLYNAEQDDEWLNKYYHVIMDADNYEEPEPVQVHHINFEENQRTGGPKKMMSPSKAEFKKVLQDGGLEEVQSEDSRIEYDENGIRKQGTTLSRKSTRRQQQ